MVLRTRGVQHFARAAHARVAAAAAAASRFFFSTAVAPQEKNEENDLLLTTCWVKGGFYRVGDFLPGS